VSKPKKTQNPYPVGVSPHSFCSFSGFFAIFLLVILWFYWVFCHYFTTYLIEKTLNYGDFNQKGTELTITVGNGIHNLYLWDIGYFSRIIAYNAQK
jgi:fatty acid desaturase